MVFENLIPFAAIPLRIALGIAMMYHGYPKILTKKGFKGYTKMMRSLKFKKPSPKFWAFASAFGEFFAGLAVFLGAFTRIGAALIAINMLIAVYVHIFKWKHPFDAREGGYEYALVLALAAIALVLLGGGYFSLDIAFSLPLA